MARTRGFNKWKKSPFVSLASTRLFFNFFNGYWLFFFGSRQNNENKPGNKKNSFNPFIPHSIFRFVLKLPVSMAIWITPFTTAHKSHFTFTRIDEWYFDLFNNSWMALFFSIKKKFFDTTAFTFTCEWFFLPLPPPVKKKNW